MANDTSFLFIGELNVRKKSVSSAAVSCPTASSAGDWQDIQNKAEEILDRLKALQDRCTLRRKDFYDVEEIAQYVGRSVYTVRKWIQEGKIKANQVTGTGSHGRLFVPYAEVQKLFVRKA
jgi:excisionase family DNA binding protein